MKKSMIIHPEEVSKKWIDRLHKAGVEVMGIHPRGGADAVNSLTEMLDLLKTEKYRELIDYARSLGLRIEYEIHSAGYIMPRELFSEKPEYFRMNESGERTGDYNFCPSNKEALDLFSKRAASLACELYGSDCNYYFWLDDGHGLCCHCRECKKHSPSDLQLLVLNSALSEIRKHIPNAKLAYLAYMDTVCVPSAVPLSDGIFLEYAPFEKYTAKGEGAEELISREKKMILPLIKFFDREEKKVLEYWYDNSLYSNWTKPPKRFILKKEEMLADVSEYLAYGFDYVSTFACYLGEDYENLYGEVDIEPFGEILA